MKLKSFLFIIVIYLCFPINSFAWGAKGHQLVAEVAFHYLPDSTKEKVTKYFKKMSPEEMATWMDDMRSEHYYDFMKPWHYINIEKGETYKPTAEKNILTVLHEAIKDLEHKENMSFKDIHTDLEYIFHLIGDLHQPLHVGYGIDKGGNSIQVSFISKSSGSNLHRVWDQDIIDEKNITLDSCLQQYNTFTAADIIRIKKLDVMQWMMDSRSLLDKVYDFKDGYIDRNYVETNSVVIQKQILIAGLRLESILEHLFQ